MKSMDMWFNYKAQRIEKKRMISVELRVHGIDMFREEQWDTTIRPAVLKTLGHDDNRSKEWIGTVKKVQGSLWHGLDDEERKRYERQAKETNEKNGGHGVFCSADLDWSLIGKITVLTAMAAAGFIIVKQMRK